MSFSELGRNSETNWIYPPNSFHRTHTIGCRFVNGLFTTSDDYGGENKTENKICILLQKCLGGIFLYFYLVFFGKINVTLGRAPSATIFNLCPENSLFRERW